MRLTGLSAIVLTLLVPPAVDADETLADRMLGRLHGRAVTCPGDVDGQCAEVDHDFKDLKKTLSMYVDSSRGRRVVVSFVGAWERDGAFRTRRWLEGDEIVQLLFDPVRRLVVVQNRFFCLAVPPAHAAGDRDVTDPRRVAGSMPGYPAPGKVGNAVLQLHVTEEGRVADACVLYSRPTGQGFGRAALAAVHSWRFEPGLVDGRAVDTAVAYDFVWRQGGCSFRRSVRSLR